MDIRHNFLDMRSILERGQIDKRFPKWKSIEIFGAPGAGKSFFCRNLIRLENITTTADNIVMTKFADERMGKFFNFLNRKLGHRVMKNYYKIQSDLVTKKFWSCENNELTSYMETVEEAIDQAKLPRRSEKNVRKSILNTGVALGLCYKRQERVLIDEGLVRKLITLIVQSDTNATVQLERLRNCLEKYPWDKKAIFIDAAIETSKDRQESRGHVINGPGKTQSDQQAAAFKVWSLCRESGWDTLRVGNESNFVLNSN